MDKFDTTIASVSVPVGAEDSTGLPESDRRLLLEAMNEDLMAVAKAAGLRAAFDIMSALGGSTIYVPGLDEVMRGIRDERIRLEYSKGDRVKAICRRYRLSERTVYKVLRRKPRRVSGRLEAMLSPGLMESVLDVAASIGSEGCEDVYEKDG